MTDAPGEHQPALSIIMPVYNTEPAELREAIQSVLNQSYESWELCIADDHSSRSEVRPVLDTLSDGEQRIKIAFRPERGGISAASNTAWSMASGEYVAFLDHDDVLAPHALAYVCEALTRSPEADLIYSDEDKIDHQGKRFQPFFKPNWSPDLLL